MMKNTSKNKSLFLVFLTLILISIIFIPTTFAIPAIKQTICYNEPPKLGKCEDGSNGGVTSNSACRPGTTERATAQTGGSWALKGVTWRLCCPTEYNYGYMKGGAMGNGCGEWSGAPSGVKCFGTCQFLCEPSNNGVEICDGKDNDCDGIVDNNCDDDKDGYCDKNIGYADSAKSTTCPNGKSDCDDDNKDIYPKEGPETTCDGIDSDCDGQIDDGLEKTCDKACQGGTFLKGIGCCGPTAGEGSISDGYICGKKSDGTWTWIQPFYQTQTNNNIGGVYSITPSETESFDVLITSKLLPLAVCEPPPALDSAYSSSINPPKRLAEGEILDVTRTKAGAQKIHQYLCNPDGMLFECAGNEDPFNTNQDTIDYTTYGQAFSPGATVSFSEKDFMCYDGIWYNIKALTPDRINSRGLCEAVVGDTPSMGWIGDKDTGGAWCCFKTGQYMGNAVNGKSCWDGRVIENREIVDGTENKVINDNGKFFYCAGDAAAVAGVNPLSEGLVLGTIAGVSGGWPPKESRVSKYYNEPLSNRGPYFTLTSSSRNYIKLPAKVDSTVTISVWGKIS